MQKNKQINQWAKIVLPWYDLNHRNLPWRISPTSSLSHSKLTSKTHNQITDPYPIWLSEIMLQQTTVTTVIPYFEKFISKWPNISALAAENEEEVLKAWAGLGYYSRARNLKKCANYIQEHFNGIFPTSASELIKLPGIGPYTSAAIAAIAFGQRVGVVDGNIERVTSRIFSIDTPFPKAKPIILDLITEQTPKLRSGDFAQALMDIGATICTPKKPKCKTCPMDELCSAYVNNEMEQFPIKAPRKKKPTRVGAVYIIMDSANRIFLEKREATGLLAGMDGLPTTLWTSRTDGDNTTQSAPIEANWQNAGIIRHVFTHFTLDLTVFLSQNNDENVLETGKWVSSEAVYEQALPTVFCKALKLAGI